MKLKYIMNFKPKIRNYSKINKSVQNKLIDCKNFIFIILLFESLAKQSNTFDDGIDYSYFIFKKKNNVGSIIRAPYKNKTSQFKLKILRYHIILKFRLKVQNNIYISNFLDFFKLIENILKSFHYFESTMITQNSKLLSIPVIINIDINKNNIY